MIDQLFKFLRPFISYVIRRPIPVIIISLSLALIGLLLALNLRIDNDLSKLIPSDFHSVQALNTLREQVGGEHEAAIAISSPSFESNKKFGEAFFEPALNLTGKNRSEPYFVRGEFRKNVDFIKHTALYFATSNELDLIEDFLTSEIQRAREQANPFYFELDDEIEADSLADELNQRYEELVGSEYLISADSTVLVIKLFPKGAQTDLQFIEDAYADLNQLINQLNPSQYHPEMKVVAAGRMLHTLIEIETIAQDVKSSFGAGVFMLMAAVLMYFFYKSYRIRYGMAFSPQHAAVHLQQVPAHAIIMGLPLVISLCWTFGIAYLAFENLNIMTSTLGLILFGMGIDFGIHFFARYAEQRGNGYSPSESIITTFMTTGQAIFAVGSTTSAAFFILMLADFKGFSEFGFIAGIGLLFAIITYTVFLPALLVLLEKTPFLNLTPDPHSSSHQTVSHINNDNRKWWPISVLILALFLSVLSVWRLPGLQFEYNFGKLEPVYENYQELNRLVEKVYSDRRTRNAAYIIVDDGYEAVEAAEIIRGRAEADVESPTIRDVEVFQDRFPFTEQAVDQKLERLSAIRELLNDPFLSASENEDLDRLELAASPEQEIPLDSVPIFIRAPFTSHSGEIGNLVIIHPSVRLSDGRNSMAFSDDVSAVTLENDKTYYAGSTSIVASDMLRLMINETPIMLILTIVCIILFKMLILGRLTWIFFALIPLVLSFIWLFGLMGIFGWKLNFYNLVVLPVILGIGDDSGVHIVHRYLEEGKGSVSRVLTSTGEHISVSVITTLLGFAGLLFSDHPGIHSIGQVAILGISLSLIAAILILPSLLRLYEQKTLRDAAVSRTTTHL